MNHTLDHVPTSAINRFWKYAIPAADDACWKWAGAKHALGYGRLSVTFPEGTRVETPHRISYVIHHGPIPAGMVVMHTCDNPECSNPDHLVLGTQADNIRDRDQKGRNNSKFDQSHIEDAKSLYQSGLSLSDVGERLGHPGHVIRYYLVKAGVKLRPPGRHSPYAANIHQHTVSRNGAR